MAAPTTLFRYKLVILRELATEKSVLFFVNDPGERILRCAQNDNFHAKHNTTGECGRGTADG